MSPALSYCKLCELEDFSSPDLRDTIRDVSVAGDLPDEYPRGAEHRKQWEIAMTVRALGELGALGDDAEILGVGAGREATIFWLTRHVRRVFATDLYGSQDAWSGKDSGAGMLLNPSAPPGFDWNPRRLVVQHMDALDMHYEDSSFDGIFSSGSIEHFGELEDIRRSVVEMHRVLKPGGVAALATEFRLEGGDRMPGTLFFDEPQLRSVLLDGLDWEPASPLDLSISESTRRNEIDFGALIASMPKPPAPSLRTRLGSLIAGGGLATPPGAPAAEPETPYPHIVLRYGEHLWTSVHLALIKRA